MHDMVAKGRHARRKLKGRHNNDLVVLRLADFEEWFGDVPEPAPALPAIGGGLEAPVLDE